MRTLHVQLQPDVAPDVDVPSLRDLLVGLAGNPLVQDFECVEGDDDGRYISFNYQSPDHAALWRELCSLLHGVAEPARQLRASTIIACEGSDGWDNYLLLHHFNPTVPLDSEDGL